MKKEALKLADEMDGIEFFDNPNSDPYEWACDAQRMIRRLVEELDATEKAYKWTEIARNAPTKPLSDADIQQISHRYHFTYNPDYVGFARAIEKEHGIK